MLPMYLGEMSGEICSWLPGKCSSFRDRQAKLLLLSQSLSFLSLTLPLCDVGRRIQGCHVEPLQGHHSWGRELQVWL